MLCRTRNIVLVIGIIVLLTIASVVYGFTTGYSSGVQKQHVDATATIVVRMRGATATTAVYVATELAKTPNP